MRKGIELLEETPGEGPAVARGRSYEVRLRLWLHRGEAVRWTRPAIGLEERTRLEDDGAVLVTTLRVDREHLFPGLLYGIEGMQVGGVRRLRIAPHLGYGQAGVPGIIPPNALLVAQVEILAERER